MTRDVPASETFVNMPVARPRDMRFSRNSRLRKRRGHGTITTDWTPATWILDYNGWIPDSKAVDSGFHRPKLPGFRITDYLTWRDTSVYIVQKQPRENITVEFYFLSPAARIGVSIIEFFQTF